MKTTLRFFKMGIIVAWLASCSDLKTSIREDFNQSISKNAQAISHLEWEASEAQPKVIFSKYLEQYNSLIKTSETTAAKKISNEICSGLSQLSDDSLALFESEIKSNSNTVLVKSCRESLLNQIDAFYKSDRSGLQYSVDATSTRPSNIDFKLKMELHEDVDLAKFNKFYGDLKDHEVILTFDDGPHATYTDSILRTLKEAGNIKAFFFVLGSNVKRYPEKVKSEYQQGHVVANHTWNHYCLDNSTVCRNYNKKNYSGVGLLSDSDVLREIENTFAEIKKTIGTTAPFFRFPFGNERPVTTQYLKNHGNYIVNWSIDSNDWRQMQTVAGQEVPYTNKDMIKTVINEVEYKKKGIILFHDIHRRSAESLPQVLFELYKRNYKVIVLKTKSMIAPSPAQEGDVFLPPPPNENQNPIDPTLIFGH